MTLFVSNISKCTRSHTLTVVQGRGGGGGGGGGGAGGEVWRSVTSPNMVAILYFIKNQK